MDTDPSRLKVESFGTNAAVGYSQATRAGDLVHVSGQVAVDGSGVPVGIGDIEVQTQVAFDRLGSMLEAAGSGLSGVLKVTVYTTDRRFVPVIRAVRQRVFAQTSTFPASTFVVVAGLAEPEYLIEVEAVALRGGGAG